MKSFLAIVFGLLFAGVGVGVLWAQRATLSIPVLAFATIFLLIALALVAPADATAASGTMKTILTAISSAMPWGRDRP